MLSGAAYPACRASSDRTSRQVGCVLAAPRRPGQARGIAAVSGVPAGAGQATADARAGELIIQFGDQLIELGRALACISRLIALDLGAGPQAQPEFLLLVRHS